MQKKVVKCYLYWLIHFNNNDIESLSMEIENKRSKTIILIVIYWEQNRDSKVSENYFNDFFSKHKKNYTKIIFEEDLKTNALNFENNKREGEFSNQMISTINKPTRVTQHTETAVDHIITITQFNRGIILAYVPDHSPIIFTLKTNENRTKI